MEKISIAIGEEIKFDGLFYKNPYKVIGFIDGNSDKFLIKRKDLVFSCETKNLIINKDGSKGLKHVTNLI